jgi:hypothetical protein
MAMIAGPAEASTWRRWRDAPRVCVSARSLCRTLAVALVVGTALFAINQLDLVLSGRATGRVWLKAALTYLVLFLVANYGLLVGSRRAEQARHDGGLPVMRRKESGQSD